MTIVNPYNATLIEREDLNGSLAIFKVRFDSGEKLEFEPGQFTTLGLIDPDAPVPAANSRRRGPKMIRRAYSIANTPKQQTDIEFYIVRVDGGRFTPLLWQLKPGDPLFMDTKVKGTFTLDDIPDGKDLVMVGTGTGVAPYLSMLNAYRASGCWRKLILIECCRTGDCLGYYDELTKIATEDDSVTYLPTLTREPEDSGRQGLRGRVHKILAPEQFKTLTGITLNPEQCHVLLCGNPEMIDQATKNLNVLGFVTKDRARPGGNLHFERYW